MKRVTKADLLEENEALKREINELKKENRKLSKEECARRTKSFQMAAYAYKKKSESLQEELLIAQRAAKEVRNQKASFFFRVIQPLKWILNHFESKKNKSKEPNPDFVKNVLDGLNVENVTK